MWCKCKHFTTKENGYLLSYVDGWLVKDLDKVPCVEHLSCL